MSVFQKATRRKTKLKLGIEGPSGSGKTYSALLVARGLVGPEGKIAVLDSENESSNLYEHLTDYDVAPIDPPYTPEKYIKLIQDAEASGYDVLVIDSITHEWKGQGGCLEIHASMPGNSFTNWGKVTPRHKAFVDTILQSKMHVICTMRSKETHALEENDRGKVTPKKLGLEAEVRSGTSYEFTTVLSMDISHQATSSKDRTGLFPADQWFKPSIETGQKLRDWCLLGKEAVKYVDEAEVKEFLREASSMVGKDTAWDTYKVISGKANFSLTAAEFEDVKKNLMTACQEQKE